MIRLLLGLILFPTILLAQQRPNIIYIMTDDMGYADLSGYGRKDYKTPNLDKLASQGMKFVNAYSAAPVCTPTRVGLMTGRYPARTPVGLIEPLTASPNDRNDGLTSQIPSLAALVKTASYQTALIGKWHLGLQPEHSPTKNGFDYFFGFRSGASDYVSHGGDGDNHDLWENDSLVYPQGYLTELISEKAVSYISAKHDLPYLLVINFNAPHWPWQGPNDPAYPDSVSLREGGSPEIYQAMMESLDNGVGRIMAAIDQYSPSNTIVIFTNDNGGERFSDHGGLSKSKATLWEGGIRVPAFVRWPEKIKPGQVTDQVAITMDWTATILNLAGVKNMKALSLDGIDLMPVLTNKTKRIDRTLYWRTFQWMKQKAMRMGDWKYLQDAKGEEYLFDLKNDQAEKNNLKEQNEAVFLQLKEKYAAWEKTVLEPVALQH